MESVPEAKEYINKFYISGKLIPWDAIDEIPYRDYQLFVIMLNAHVNKVNANNQGAGGGTMSDVNAIMIEGGVDSGGIEIE